jgi:hypothetical protein
VIVLSGMCPPHRGSHGRTTDAFTLLISIRFSLEIPKGPGHPEGYPGPVVIQLVACVTSPDALLYPHGSAGTGVAEPGPLREGLRRAYRGRGGAN